MLRARQKERDISQSRAQNIPPVAPTPLLHPHKEKVEKKYSRPANIPLQVLDAHLLTGLLIIVIPLLLHQIDGIEHSPGLDALGLPLAL
jgi:hypothetical protein